MCRRAWIGRQVESIHLWNAPQLRGREACGGDRLQLGGQRVASALQAALRHARCHQRLHPRHPHRLHVHPRRLFPGPAQCLPRPSSQRMRSNHIARRSHRNSSCTNTQKTSALHRIPIAPCHSLSSFCCRRGITFSTRMCELRNDKSMRPGEADRRSNALLCVPWSVHGRWGGRRKRARLEIFWWPDSRVTSMKKPSKAASADTKPLPGGTYTGGQSGTLVE